MGEGCALGKEQLELLVERTIWEVWVRRNRDMNRHRLVGQSDRPDRCTGLRPPGSPTAQVNDMVRGGDV